MHKQASTLHKKRKQFKENLLLNELVYTGEQKSSTQIELIQYGPDSMGRKSIATPETIKSAIHPQQVNWIRTSGISDTPFVARIGKAIDIHQLDTQDILLTQHIAKIEVYEHRTLLLVNSFSFTNENEFQQEHISIVLGENFVATFQETDNSLFDNLYKAIELNTTMIRNKGNDYLFFLLINAILNQNIGTLAHLEDQLSDMEDELIDENPGNNFMKRIQENRHRCTQIKKALIPLKEDFKMLIFNENSLIKPENAIYVNDIDDRLKFLLQSIDSSHESSSSILEWYLSNNSLKMNEIMKRLTIVATIFIPLTFVVGVWGMNFKVMPELEWQYGYPVALSILTGTALAAAWYIKRKKWD